LQPTYLALHQPQQRQPSPPRCWCRRTVRRSISRPLRHCLSSSCHSCQRTSLRLRMHHQWPVLMTPLLLRPSSGCRPNGNRQWMWNSQTHCSRLPHSRRSCKALQSSRCSRSQSHLASGPHRLARGAKQQQLSSQPSSRRRLRPLCPGSAAMATALQSHSRWQLCRQSPSHWALSGGPAHQSVLSMVLLLMRWRRPTPRTQCQLLPHSRQGRVSSRAVRSSLALHHRLLPLPMLGPRCRRAPRSCAC
jgi:hypothetical protein